MHAMPTLILALVYWLHLLASVVWLGGLAMLVAAAWPGARRAAGDALDGLERRFRPLANVSLLVLLVTGMIQMGGDPHYEGWFAVRNAWSAGLLAKHLVVLGMIGVSLMLQFGAAPALERTHLLAERGVSGGESERAAARRRLRRLTAANLALGVVVLMLTAYMTAL
jgi:uncharacterized membrane protein